MNFAFIRNATRYIRQNLACGRRNIVAVYCLAPLIAAGFVSCISPLDIDTPRWQTATTPKPLPAKYLSLTFEGGDILGVQDGWDISWYSGVTDSVLIDTTKRVTTFRLNLNNVKVKNVLVSKDAYLNSMSIKFDSLACSNIERTIVEGASANCSAEMFVKNANSQQLSRLVADGRKNIIVVSAVEYRSAKMLQFKIMATMNDTAYPNQREMKFVVKGLVVY